MVKLFLDGRLNTQGSIKAIAAKGCGINPMRYIGWTGDYPNLYLQCFLDEMRVYGRVLSESEIATHFNFGRGEYGKPGPDLIAGWHFDDQDAGSDESRPMSLNGAIQAAAAGDLFWLLDGTYSGLFTITNSGTPQAPIVFRARPNQHPVINGGFSLLGSNIWIWVLEITNRERTQNLAGIDMLGAGLCAINNVIHHCTANGVGAWNDGPGQVVYGNIIYENGSSFNNNAGHGIYTQNSFDRYGYKHIIENVFLDSASVNENAFNVHAYTAESADLTGFWVEKNIVRNGRFLIGGFNKPVSDCIVKENYFYRSGPQLGYRRPTQSQVLSNYVGRGGIETAWFWGEGETMFTKPGPNIYRGNTVLLPAAEHVIFQTSAYLSSGRCEGCPRIPAGDIFDFNQYSQPFIASFSAANTNVGANIETWRAVTAAAGNPFDVHSTLVSSPFKPKIVLLPNEYEKGRAHLVIYNWNLRSNVNVDLSAVIPSGARYRVHNVKDAFGTPVLSGTYTGPVSIPTGGEEFLVLLVTLAPNTAPIAPGIGDRTVAEVAEFSVTITATDNDVPAQSLVYSLMGDPPAGATIDPITGVFKWKPNESQGPGNYSITVRVQDNGDLALSTSASFKLTVTEVQSPPSLAAIPDVSIDELRELAFSVTATDPDLPANALTFSLDRDVPSGASISSAGAFRWTPSKAQGPGAYPITVRVTDNGTPPLSDTKTFTITVNEVNSAPILNVISNQLVEEGHELVVSATATDADIPANVLTFTLSPGAPSGMTIDSAAGVIKWTPPVGQGPGPYSVTVQVTDNGWPPLSDAKTFNVTVTPKPNTAPVLTAIADQTLNELATLVIDLSATDADLPPNALNYSVVSAPTGLTVNPSTGRVTWTPTDAQGPSVNVITVLVTDNGLPPLSDSKTFNVIVNEVNDAPVLAAIPDKNANVGSPLSFAVAATDADLPANTLAYTLEPGAPAGATIDPVSGAFTWTPTPAQESTTNQVSVRVTDNGTPPLSDTKSFAIIMSAQPRGPVQLSASLQSDGSVKLVWNTTPGRNYTLQRSADLATWEDLITSNATDVSLEYLDTETSAAQARFFRVVQR